MDDETRLAEHLKTLAICHYVYAGLVACGSCVGGFYVVLAVLFSKAIEHAPAHTSQPQAEEVGRFVGLVFGGFGIALIVVALTLATLYFVSGRAIARRRSRTLSLVVAGFSCLNFPLGTALGVFTFIVLMKPETERLYAREAGGDLPAG